MSEPIAERLRVYATLIGRTNLRYTPTEDLIRSAAETIEALTAACEAAVRDMTGTYHGTGDSGPNCEICRARDTLRAALAKAAGEVQQR